MAMDRKVLVAIGIAVIVIVGVASAAILLTMSGKGGAVYYVPLAPANMKAALSTDQVDAYIAWEPYVSDSVAGHVGDVLLWSQDIMPNHPCCVVVLRTGFLSDPNGPELVKRFVKAHVDATQWMVDALSDKTGPNYTALVDMAIGFTARNATVVEAAFDHLKYLYAMNTDFYSALEEFTDMYIELNMTSSQKIADRGYTSVGDFVSKYTNETFLDTADSIEPSATILNPTSPIRLGFLLGDLHQMAQVVAQNKSLSTDGKSFFEKYGVAVTTAPGAPFTNGGAEMDAFAAGNVDLGYLGAPPAIIKHLNGGTQTQIVAQVNAEGSGLVVKSGLGITSLEGLVNRTVAVPGPPAESSIQFLLLKIALEREGLQLKVAT